MQDVCDRLWDICDRRRQDWEDERTRIMEEQWMEDHLGLLVNTYINIMQVHACTCSYINIMQVHACSYIMYEVHHNQLDHPLFICTIYFVRI